MITYVVLNTFALKIVFFLGGKMNRKIKENLGEIKMEI